jgi:hypothetical protein
LPATPHDLVDGLRGSMAEGILAALEPVERGVQQGVQELTAFRADRREQLQKISRVLVLPGREEVRVSDQPRPQQGAAV